MPARPFVLAGLAGALLAGCADGPAPVADAPSRAAASRAASSSAASSPAVPSAAASGPVARCRTAGLSVAAGEPQPSASTRRLLVSLTNTGSAPCTLTGFGGAGLLDAQGTPLPTRTERTDQVPGTVRLAPGSSTVRELSWRVVPSGTADPATDCVEAVGLVVTPPDEEPGDLRVDVPLTACDGGTLVGTPWGQTAP